METVTTAPAAAGSDGARRANLPIGTRFAASPTYNPDARTVEMVAATETPVRMPGWLIGIDADYYLEILDCRAEAVDLAQVQAGNAPVLDTHGRWSLDDRLGVVQSARFEPGQVIALAAFGQSEKARSVEAEVAAGTPPKPSVGYRRNQMIFERMENDVPVYRVTRWTFVEVSLCPIAADLNAGVRTVGDLISPCNITERKMADEANGAAAPTNNTVVTEPSGAAAEGTRAASPPQQQGAQRRNRLLSGSAAVALLDEARSFGEDVVTRAKELIEKNETDEIGIEAIRAGILAAAGEAQRAQTGGIGTGGRAIQMGEGEAEKMVKGATAAILIRAGLAPMVREAAGKGGPKIDLDPGEFAGIRNVELARMCIERAGVRVDSYDRDQVVAQAIMLRSGGPYQTTSMFANLLENVMHKTLQAAYAVAPDTWRSFCGIASVTDFRPHPRLLKGTFGALDALTQSGEFKNKAIPDAAKESIVAKTKGNIVALSRQAIVNDDLSAFSDITVELGRAAKLTIEKDVYALLGLNNGLGPIMNDGKTLFHSDHNNMATTGGIPSVDTIGAMRNLIGSQKDVSGNEVLDIPLSVFLGSRALADKAKVVNNSEYDPDTANKLQRANIERGTFDAIVGTARLTGTRWYGFADPNLYPTIEVAFLNGQQEPYTEMKEGWRVDGTEWKVRHDYGVGGTNWRAAATNAGA